MLKEMSFLDIYKKPGTMTEQISTYRIYKLLNSKTSKVYIGSTKNSLKIRLQQHIHDCFTSKRCEYTVYKYFHNNDITKDDISMELIKEIICNRRTARIQEQICIWQQDKENLLNHLRAFTHNTEKTRDNEKKKKTRRDYYHRKMKDPEFVEKERERNRIRMRKKRALIKEQRQRLNGGGQK